MGLVLTGLIQLRGTVLNVSAVETQQDIGVYWDQKCTRIVSSINWGTLTPGQTKTVTFYVRNEGNSTVRLVLSTANYNPSSASSYIILSTSANNSKLDANQTILATTNLKISSKIKGITGFSFDLTINGAIPIPGDLNFDGRIDIGDAILFAQTYGASYKDPRFDANADFNKDGSIDILDAMILSRKMP